MIAKAYLVLHIGRCLPQHAGDFAIAVRGGTGNEIGLGDHQRLGEVDDRPPVGSTGLRGAEKAVNPFVFCVLVGSLYAH